MAVQHSALTICHVVHVWVPYPTPRYHLPMASTPLNKRATPSLALSQTHSTSLLSPQPSVLTTIIESFFF